MVLGRKKGSKSELWKFKSSILFDSREFPGILKDSREFPDSQEFKKYGKYTITSDQFKQGKK